MDSVIRQKLTAWLDQANLNCALLTTPASVDWASGHITGIETGPNPFAGGPTALLVEKCTATLVYPDCEAPDLDQLGLRGLAYASYTADDSFAPDKSYREKLRELMAGKSEVGIEQGNLPADISGLPTKARSIDGHLAPLRAVKTPAELTAIRAALKLCDRAQAVLPELVQPGRTELAVWGDLRAVLEATAGQRLPFVADFVSGPRTAEIGGPPTNRVIQAGEWVLADIVPRLGNYWGDICGVIPAGEPSARFMELKQLSEAALDFAISLIKPGAIAGDIDRQTREFIAQRGYTPYPHHTGHGIGVCYHEAPRIVAGDQTLLVENMVIALEPGIYFPGECGVRMEDVVRVTANGAEVLTQHRQS
jgi:Xaa-Pro dipeptidase